MNLKIRLFLCFICLSMSAHAFTAPHGTASDWLKASEMLEEEQLPSPKQEQLSKQACWLLVNGKARKDSPLLQAIEGFLSQFWQDLSAEEINEACNKKIRRLKIALPQHEVDTENINCTPGTSSMEEEQWIGQVQVFDHRPSTTQQEKTSSVDWLERKNLFGQVLDYDDEDCHPRQVSENDNSFQFKGEQFDLDEQAEPEKAKPTPSASTDHDWDYNPTQGFDTFGDHFGDFG